MSETARYGMFKVLATCPHCGHPVPINGPQIQPTCPACQKPVPIPAETWHSMLEEYLQSYKGLQPGEGNDSTLISGLTLKFTSVKLPPPDPACLKCETLWEMTEIKDGTDGVITCKKCGYASPTFPAPAWLTAGVPSAKQIFFAERITDGSPIKAVEQNHDPSQPIAMFCPQCSGSLLITTETERVTKCKYCNVDVFLPDELWLKLHPVKIAKFWLVRFQ